MKFGNYKKILSLLFILFCLTGCTVDYDVSVDENGIVTEVVTILEEDDIIKDINPDTADFIDRYYRLYTNIEDLFKYQKKEVFTDGKSGYTFTRTYANLEMFVNNSLFIKEGYADIKYTADEAITTIDGGDFTGIKHLIAEVNGIENGLKKITSNIEIPYYMEEYKYDTKKGNVYTNVYTVDSNNYELYFKYDINKEIVSKGFSISGQTFVILLYVGIILAIIAVVAYFNMKNNRI